MQNFSPRKIALAGLFALATTSPISFAQEMPQGFTCCNMRHEADWISDSNYASLPMIAVGQPAQVTGYGRYRAAVTIAGKPMRLGNDYSRTLSNEDFAKKWIVKDDPKLKIAKFPAEIREAIAQAKVRKGMTKEQVTMSLGHPITSENPDPNATMWRYWLSSFDEFQLVWDANGRVKEIIAAPTSMTRIVHGQ
jgi:SmpA / OmlA family